MSEVPFQHPGPVPPRPEVPEGVVPGPPPAPPAPEPAADPNATPFVWWQPLAAFLTTFVGIGVLAGMVAIFMQAAGAGDAGDDLPPGVQIPATLLQDAALIATAILFGSLGGKRLSAWTFGFRPTRFWRSVGWAAAAAVAFYLFAFVWSIAVGITENDDLAEELGAEDSTFSLVGVALLVLIAAPITEELFFRGFAFPAMSKALGWVGGAIATGFFFGIIHILGTDIEFIPPLMVFGFLLCVLYRLTGSILPCIGLHALNNAVALSVTLEWELWQIALTILLAPTVCLAIAVPVARRARPVLA